MASGALQTIGAIYSASWIATNTSSDNYTNAMTLPVGTYVIVYSMPVMATENSAIAAISFNNTLDTSGYKKMNSYDSKTLIRAIDVPTTVRVMKGSNSNISMSNIERGFLKAIKIA